MTISYNWLKEYINIHESPEEIGQVLTGTGLEVEYIEPFSTVKGGLAGLVIGEVLTCTKHPNADKLSVTTVHVGGDKVLPIVCGASNVKAGQKVVVAIPGTTLFPFKGDPFTIKSTKIRGEQSEGMICAEDEMGLGDNHEGIIVLDTKLPNGTPASEYYYIQSDYAIEIGLTPNRADAASHLGVARDIKAALNRELNWPSVDSFKTDNHKLPLAVSVENPQACPRYSGITLTGITVAESPAWLKARLQTIGLTPINNIVDITNYVLHETGQPLHAFDADEITGNKVIVKTLPHNTPFVTLDGKERKLLATDLMICNAGEGPQAGMCMAGVFGGAKSGITEKTKNIFLESAHFSADYVRRTSMHHGLKTDASFRFERGTDPNITVYALKRAALLIKEIAGGEISSDIVDIYPNKIKNKTILVKDKNVNRLIGKAIPRQEAIAILNRLDIEVTESADGHYTVSVPPYRVDVTQEADVIEEILRIYGFNNIELKEYAGSDYIAEFPSNDINKFKNTLGSLLVNNGFYEIWTNSLTNEAWQAKHKFTFEGEPVHILNKLSEEQGILRQTMLFTGLEVCAYNINRKQKDLKLFEFGKVYFKNTGHYHEQERLALYISGNTETENWQHKTASVSFYDMAQFVYQLIQKVGVAVKQQQVADPLFDYAVQLTLNNKPLGKFGKVKAALQKDFGIKQDIFYGELDTNLLFTSSNPKLVVKEVAKYPEVRRDLSLVLDRNVSFEEVQKLVQATEKRLIREIITFDVYEGDKIPEGKKAYALGFTLQDEAKTLTDEEIDSTMQRLITAFEQTLGAVIRK
ncbi:MAG: phenylalanine--tRNA ligase subunit beta [Cyclobacteriaceae bacterium]|nr:phenylalanine--tRNA ligase subunit beta [Cyclobacteriaceae bacterium]UYN87627.1 MAG: phenylalanine--tRNA ligase subunit beta [Cyclobacteriaceae bacterium]